MLKVDQYQYIRTAHRVYGKKIREIARETGHSKNTVRKALKQEFIGYKPRDSQPFPVLGPYLEIIDDWVKKDKDKPKKQRHTATRIYNRLKAECGYKGGETTVRRYVRETKLKFGINGQQVFIPLDAKPGQEAEMDWGSCSAILGGKLVKLKLFCIRSKYSGKHFVRCYPCERQQSLFDGHIQAFSFFGGVFPVLIYDNLKTVVQRVLKGKKRDLQESYKKFEAYYNFESRFCNPGQGHEKGGVEGLVGYARRNYMVPIPEAENLEALNKKLLQDCFAYGYHRMSGRHHTVNQLYEEEKKHLIALPWTPFSNVEAPTGKVDKYSTVIIDKNRYSVPVAYAHVKVQIVLYVDQVEIFWGSKKIAIHERLYGNNKWSLEPDHYLELIRRRPMAFDSARPITQWREHWPGCLEELLDLFREKQGPSKGTQEFISVLMLYKNNTPEEIQTAVEKALDAKVGCSGAVEQILRNQCQPSKSSFETLDNWGSLPSPDVSVYEQIGGAV